MVSGWFAKNLKLSLDGSERRGEGGNGPILRWEGEREEGLRKTESAPAYNLKTHSAFKLLTMAAGYKVLCRYHGRRGSARARAGRGKRKGASAIQKFDLFERRLADGTTTRRRADRGQILDGENERERREGKEAGEKNKRGEEYFAAGISAPSRCAMCVVLLLGENVGAFVSFRCPFYFRFYFSADPTRKRSCEN